MCWLEVCWCYVTGLAIGDVVSECRLNHYCSGSAYTRIPHHQQTIPPHNTSTPQVSLHNTTNSRKLLKMDVLTSETCWAVDNKASDIWLVKLYSNTVINCMLHVHSQPLSTWGAMLRAVLISHTKHTKECVLCGFTVQFLSLKLPLIQLMRPEMFFAVLTKVHKYSPSWDIH